MSDYHDDSASQSGSTRASKTTTAEDAANRTRLERKIVTKLDLLLVPSMSILYLAAFLDRTNISNARVAGLQTDLEISGYQFQTGRFLILSLPDNISLTQSSAYGDLRTVHPSRAPFKFDFEPRWASHPAAHDMHLVGSCIDTPIASEQLFWPTRMSFLPRARRGWAVPRNRSLPIRYVTRCTS
jgi:hypothetical protein